MDTSGVSGLAGLFRILTLLLGIADFGVTVDAFQHHYRNEEFFLTVVIVCLVFSSISFLFTCLRWNKPKIDIVFHIIGGTLLLIGGILMLYSVIQFGRGTSAFGRWFYGVRITSGVLGIINSIFYGILAFLLMRKS